MVNQINKIVYNMLLTDREVCIAGVGTLFVVRYGAVRTSRKSIVPPYRIVTFTAEQRGALLEEEVARVAGVDEQKAHELVERWLSAVVDGDTLTIEGVGRLRNDKFVAEESFLTALNPQGRAPMRLKPKANVGLYVFASLCMLFAVAIAGYIFVDNNGLALFDKQAEVVAQGDVSEPAAQSEIEVAEVEEAVAEPQPSVQPAEQQTVVDPSAVAESAADEILSTVQGRSYVVLGVFSTPENAAKATAQARKRDGSLHCSVYHYGSKYMVALYDASSRGECQEFVDSLGEGFGDLWIYTRK